MTLTDWYSQGETLWSLETVCFYSTIHKQCRSTGGFLQAPFPFITWTCILSRSELDVLQTGRLSCESVRNMTLLRGKPFGFKFILSRSVIFIHRAHNYSTQVHLNGLQNVYKTQFGWRDIWFQSHDHQFNKVKSHTHWPLQPIAVVSLNAHL